SASVSRASPSSTRGANCSAKSTRFSRSKAPLPKQPGEIRAVFFCVVEKPLHEDWKQYRRKNLAGHGHEELGVGLGLLDAADEHLHGLGGRHALHGAAQAVDLLHLMRVIE